MLCSHRVLPPALLYLGGARPEDSFHHRWFPSAPTQHTLTATDMMHYHNGHIWLQSFTAANSQLFIVEQYQPRLPEMYIWQRGHRPLRIRASPNGNDVQWNNLDLKMAILIEATDHDRTRGARVYLRKYRGARNPEERVVITALYDCPVVVEAVSSIPGAAVPAIVVKVRE